MTTVIDSLAAGLETLPIETPLCVGLSGGLDSVVLLHGLTQLAAPRPIRAIHVNHHLSQFADQWQQQCHDYCARLKVGLTVVSVDVKSVLNASGTGVEAAARELRYQAFSNSLQSQERLLLAHHMDDQLETFLLRLMRGAGVHGLSAIPLSREVGASRLLRPLLDVTRSQLLDYAQGNGLSWVEDDSNTDSAFDRNFCRLEVLPLLAKRWPDYRKSWGKSLQLITEAADIVDELAAQDIDKAIKGRSSVLSLNSLGELSEPRRRSALRHWLSRIEAPELGWKPLNDLNRKLTSHSGGGQILCASENFQLVAYQGQLYALRQLASPEWPKNIWSMARQSTFRLPDNGELVLQVGDDINKELAVLGDVSIRYRQGGEICKIKGRPTKSLKQLLQEASTPPWIRDRLPLIFSGDSLVYIPTIGGSDDFPLPSQLEIGKVKIIWHQPEFNWAEISKSD